MQRSQILEQVNRYLRDNYVVSVEPDLPHLLVGPDLLAGGNGRLAAIFTPKSTELRAPDQLITRFVLSRLALPKHAKCILIVDPERHTEPFISQVGRSFHQTIEVRELPSIRRIVGDSVNENIKPVADRTRQQVYARSNLLFEEASTRLQVQRNRRPAREVLAEADFRLEDHPIENFRWFQREGYRGQDRFEQITQWRSSIFLSAQRTENRRSLGDDLRQFFVFSVQMDYQLDQGVPYLDDNRFYRYTKLFIANALPAYRQDPEKYIRCAAFAGILVIQANSMNEVESLGNTVLERIRGELR